VLAVKLFLHSVTNVTKDSVLFCAKLLQHTTTQLSIWRFPLTNNCHAISQINLSAMDYFHKLFSAVFTWLSIRVRTYRAPCIHSYMRQCLIGYLAIRSRDNAAARIRGKDFGIMARLVTWVHDYHKNEGVQAFGLCAGRMNFCIPCASRSCI
jgi:hypothetical protein